MKVKYKTILLTIIMAFINSFFLIQLLSYKINPILSNYVDLEAERITSNAVDGEINKIIAEKLDKDLFIVKKNNNGEAQIIDYDTKKVNDLLKIISNNIQKELISLEDGDIDKLMISDVFKGKKFKYIDNGVVCEIPFGSLSGNGFMTNLGPTIPIKMTFLGQVNCNLKTKVTNYGINNLYLQISIHVEVKERVTMPMVSKDKIIKIDAPLAIKIIQGTVPNYYGGSISNNSNMFRLPNN